ncbi:tyrosine-type recombinase/integrase (plasmid) [Acuticoccus sp. MNP-M23]|uniref:tyrosine-type recombinase/integrase n=1 Tax=Acuticoccus sp. MNP-M23 TaxID=3072793 RepID=UPI0028157878|nr:tyrosine-type recombinase/integrase [Acuticoccus sp. MNP-M23]WMS45249.1 tyrosine-type recombinase/integrase [Acuticoccus sp. MNP-M23]
MPIPTNPSGSALTTLGDPADRVREALANLRRHEALASGAYSQNTLKAWEADSRLWSAWCSETGTTPLPASPDAIAAWIEAMAARGNKVASIRRRIATLARMHRAAGLPDPTKTDTVTLRLKAVARRIGSRQRQAKPITYYDARRIVTHLPASTIGLRDAALILIARDMLARISEVSALNVGDVTRQSDGSGLAFVASSKTDTLGEGVIVYVSPAAVAAAQAWTAAAGIAEGALFRCVDRHGNIGGRLAPRAIAAAFKRMAARAGMDVGISGHSARVGAAADLAEFGASLPEVMTAGRWKSPVTAGRYCAGQEARRGAVARFHAAKGEG